MWTKGKTIDDAIVIGVEKGGLCRLKVHVDSTLMNSTIIPCDLWHIRIDFLHYKALLIVSKVVTSLPEIQIDREGVYKICHVCSRTKEEPSFYFSLRQERLQNFLCGWKISHVDKRKNHR